MRLRDGVRWVSTGAVGVLLLLVGGFLASYALRVRLEDRIARLDRLRVDAVQLRPALTDYVLHREERALVQGQTSLSNLERRLREYSPWIDEEVNRGDAAAVRWTRVRRNVGECRALLETLVAEGGDARPAFRERNRRTAELVMARGRSLVVGLGQQHQAAVSKLQRAMRNESWTIWTLVIGLGVLSIALFMLLGRRILLPLQRLHEAALRVHRGEADIRLRVSGTDEFAELSLAFDQMLDSLEETTVSRDCLEAEVVERKRLEAELRRLAMSDPLTGAANRRAMLEAIELEVQRANRYRRPLSLVMFDIDHFKRVNDTHGHDRGDVVLQEVAARVSERLRPTDVLARWGGEEFLILAPETSFAQALELAESVRSRLDGAPVPGVGSVTASLGVSEYLEGESIDEWIIRVDGLTYLSKRKGRNQVQPRPEALAAALRPRDLAEWERRAPSRPEVRVAEHSDCGEGPGAGPLPVPSPYHA